nr:reverse transcriptase domain-containing protein [Tanacetum cinerariifolium]
MSIPHDKQGPPPAGPPPRNNNVSPPVVRPNGPAPRSMEELCQPGRNFYAKTPEECYDLIENMTAHHNHWDILATQDETSRTISSTTTTESPENDFKNTMAKQHNELKNMMSSFLRMQSPSGSRSLPSNTVANPRGDVKAITTRSGIAYDGPTIPPTPSSLLKEVEQECLALADLGASINLMPLSIWKKLSLSELTPTRMTLELANRSVAYPVGVTEDVFVKVGKFYFSVELVAVDYDVDPRVPLILGRPFLRTTRALSDVHVHQVNVIDVSCEEYAQEVLRFLDSLTSGNPTPSDPIIAFYSPPFIPFEGGDFILEEIETYLRTPNELSNLDNDYFDMVGDIIYLEKLLNEDPSLNLPLMKNKDLEQVDDTVTMPSIKEPPKLELKDLPSHLKYAFLEGTRGDFILEEIETYLRTPNELSNLDNDYFDMVGDIIYLEKLLNEDPSLNLPLMKNKDLEQVDDTVTMPSIKEPPKLELKDLPCMMAIFHNMIEETMEVFMDDFSVFEDSFSSCLSHLDKMLKRPKLPTVASQFPLLDDVFTAKKPLISSRISIIDPQGNIMVRTAPLRKSLIPTPIGRRFIAMPMTWLSHVTHVNVKAKSRKKTKCLKRQFKYARSLTYGASTLWDRSRLLDGPNTFSWPLTTCLNGLKRKCSPLMMPELL